MLRSMFSGVSGLRSHQTMMDVIGNNIANVNTAGYKSSSMVFQDLLSQALRGAGAPGQNAQGTGGTNAVQIGLGVQVGGISTSFTQGAAQLTGRATDLSIQGDGFFVVRQQGQQLYTRSGSLNFDALGRLTTPDGSVVQGWSAVDGVVNPNGPVGDLRMPLGQNIAPESTGSLKLGGNLDADAAEGTSFTTSIVTYDRLGRDVNHTFTFVKSATENEWTLEVRGPEQTAEDDPLASWTLEFDPETGALVAGDELTFTPDTGVWDGPVTVDLGQPGDPEAIQQFAGRNSVSALSQDGSSLGSLQSFTIGPDGTVTGVFSNGRTQSIGQLAMASFANPGGLEKVGSSLYRAGVNSGLANVGGAGTGGRGTIIGSTLEMSNVDLAQEFTNLIVAQRGFQANSRVISASDEILQDLVNLKR